MREDAASARQRHGIEGLCLIGELCLRRHLALRAEAPNQATAMYLRQGIACARAIARLARTHPDWLDHALLLLETIITAAQDTEEALALAGRNSTPYLAVWIAAETLVLQLQDREAQDQATQSPDPARNPPAMTAPLVPHRAPAPRPISPAPPQWGGSRSPTYKRKRRR